MLVRPVIAILLPAAAAAAGAWSINQQLELVTNGTDEGSVLDRINFGYTNLGFDYDSANYSVSVIEVVPLAVDDALAANWSCLDSCQLWKLEFQGITSDRGLPHQALFYTGSLAYYDDTDTPGQWQGPIGAFYSGPPSLLPFEFLNFYGATLSELDTPGEEEAAETISETHASTSARSAVAAAAASEAWSVTQLLELVTNVTEEELVLEAVMVGYRIFGFESFLSGFNVSVVEVTPVAVDDALAANWSCFDSCHHWVVELYGIAPDQDSAHNFLGVTGYLAFYDDTATPGPGQGPISAWYFGPPSSILPIELLNFYGTSLIHLDRPMEEEAVETTSETQTLSTTTGSLTTTTTTRAQSAFLVTSSMGPGERTTPAESTDSEAQTNTVDSSCRPRSPPPLALALALALAAAAQAPGGAS